MEARFHHDFSRVRVHSEQESSAAAAAHGALAYTIGSDIVFGQGRYQPSTTTGRRLLAHELAHVVQQAGSSSATRIMGVSAPSDAAERAASATTRVFGQPQTPDRSLALRRQDELRMTHTYRPMIQRAVASPESRYTPGDQTYLAWSKVEVRRIQRELRRLRLYALRLDGILGDRSIQGLVEAFGGEEWRSLDAATALRRLEIAVRPRNGGKDFRYGELFKDDVLDITFGYGFMEELSDSEWKQYAEEIEIALRDRGYTEDAKRAADLYRAAGRTVHGFGRFFVKEKAFEYQPPAGRSRSIAVIIRFIMNPSGLKGAEARKAFQEGMAGGDVAYYYGHARYGSGPDFDRYLGSFTLKRADGAVEQVIDDYEVLQLVLRKEAHGGNAWAQFLSRWKDGRLEVDFSNAGNLRLTAQNLHPQEFGAELINWAIRQTGTVVATGKGGSLATAAALECDRRYRILVFDGCRTRDYVKSIRATPGFDPSSTDIIATARTVGYGAEAEALMAFLDGLVVKQSAQEVVNRMNQEMRGHESGYVGPPFRGCGFADNPSR